MHFNYLYAKWEALNIQLHLKNNEKIVTLTDS